MKPSQSPWMEKAIWFWHKHEKESKKKRWTSVNVQKRVFTRISYWVHSVQSTEIHNSLFSCSLGKHNTSRWVVRHLCPMTTSAKSNIVWVSRLRTMDGDQFTKHLLSSRSDYLLANIIWYILGQRQQKQVIKCENPMLRQGYHQHIVIGLPNVIELSKVTVWSSTLRTPELQLQTFNYVEVKEVKSTVCRLKHGANSSQPHMEL